MSFTRTLTAISLLAAAGSASAHPGHEAMSFFTGLSHPLGGLDHLLAMLAVGVFAANQRGRARALIPASFILAMIAGALLGANGVTFAYMEAGVATSVLVLGLMIALLARPSLAITLPLVAAFALFHGLAHHTEMASNAFMTYTVGFVCTTAMLHALGFVAARFLPDSSLAARVKQTTGALIAVSGSLLLGS